MIKDQLPMEVVLSTQQDPPPAMSPRLHDAIKSRSHSTQAEVHWAQKATRASVWAFEGTHLALLAPLGSAAPVLQSLCWIALNSASGKVSFPATATSAEELYGSFLLLRFCTAQSFPKKRSHLQKRANTRFKISPLFPLFCFSMHEADGRVSAFRTLDISNGGVSLVCSRPGRALFAGLQLDCTFDSPSVGTFKATLVIRAIVEESDKGEQMVLRVAAEFIDRDANAREIISSCLLRPLTSNSIKDLKRENLLSGHWPSLIEFSLFRPQVRSIGLTKSFEKQFDDLQLVGRLADETICSLNVEASDPHFVGSPLLDELVLLERTRNELSSRASAYGLDDLRASQQIESLRNLEANQTQSPSSRAIARVRRLLTRSAHSKRVRWDEYAAAYDIMCGANPEYESNLALFRDWLSSIDLPDESVVCDVGAGTGNYAIEIATRFPTARVIHLDGDPVMNGTASKKYRATGITNIEFSVSSVAEAEFPDASLDLIVCVNALYTFGDAEKVLKKFHSWLKPTGRFFVIDLGRPMDVADWSKYIIGASLRKRGVGATLSSFIRGRKAIHQNRRIRHQQNLGHYWLHSPQGVYVRVSRCGLSSHVPEGVLSGCVRSSRLPKDLRPDNWETERRTWFMISSVKLTDITFEIRNHVAHITINRPEVYNAFRAQTCEELIAGIRRGIVGSFGRSGGAHVAPAIVRSAPEAIRSLMPKPAQDMAGAAPSVCRSNICTPRFAIVRSR